MSKLARKPISTENVEVSFSNNILFVKGKHGELSLEIPGSISLSLSEKDITISTSSSNVLGLYCALVKNMVSGVTNKFYEQLVLKGVGYRVLLSDKDLNFNLGYSHPVVYRLPEGVEAVVPTQTEIKLSGVDKQKVGQAAAQIINLRPAKKDPYKEKGIKRVRDKILKKVGKKVK